MKIENESPKDQRSAWEAPTVIRMKAGEAEVGTRTRVDGAFTVS